MFVSAEFVSISNNVDGTTIGIIRDTHGDREIRITISMADASRIALFSFGVSDMVPRDLTQQIITEADAKIESIKIRPKGPTSVKVQLTLKVGAKSFVVTPTPGEAILLSIENKTPLLISEELFSPKKILPSLGDSIRQLSTDAFGTINL
jgi:bifunctional DNase/RNase